MNFNIKKTLLASTAIIAVASFAPASAQAATLTLTGASTWGTTAPVNAPTAGDDVVMTTFSLLIDNTLNTAAGAITATTGDLTISDSAGANISQTIGSFVSTGAGDFIILGNDANTANITAAVTGDLTTGGALSVTQTETSTADDMLLTVGDDLTVTGATTLTAGAFAGATSAITVTDDAAFTAAVTVTGGAGAGSLATLTIGGDATFTGGLNLATNDKSILVLNGTSAQAVSGVISGAGDINITGTGAVTFSGDSTFSGELVVNNDTNDQTVTFTGDFAGAIALGDNVTADAITANFSGTTQAISGGITGGAAETVDVNFSGGSTITLSGAASSGIDTLDITGSTTVTTNQNLAAAAITVASGSTLATTANTITGAVANAGTLVFGGGSVTGAITGAGLLDVNAGGTFTGALTQGTADIAGVTLTQGAASGYTIGSTNFSGAGTLALLNGSQTVTGNFTNTTDGQGTITIADGAGTTTIVGDLGASTSHSLAALTLGGGNTQTVTTTGSLFVDVISVDDADILQFLGTGAQTVSGVIRGVGANDGVITVGNGTTATPTVTFSGLLGGGGNDPGALTVNTGATAIFAAGGVHEIDGAITNTGTVQVNRGDTLSTAGASVDASVGTLNIGVGKAAGTQNFGIVIEGGDDVNLANDTVHFVVSSLQPLTTGASVLGNVFQGNAQNTIAGSTVTDNSYIYSFALVDDVNNIDVTVAQENTIASGTESSAHANAGNVLLTDLATSTDADINAAQGAMVAASTAEALDEVLESVVPTIDGGAVLSGFTASVQSLDANSNRLAAVRDGNETGMVAGEIGQGVEAWIQGFGQLADHDKRDGIDGYESDTLGVAVGVDTANIVDGGRIGLALSYANSDVESKNANSTDTDVSSYQVSLYGDTDLGAETYLEGMLGFAWNDIDQTRHNVGFAGNTADADFDSNQVIAYAEAGRDYAIGGKATFTPSILAHYQHISVDDYTETGAGGLNLSVDNDNLDIFELGLGAEVSWDLEGANGADVRPAINAGYRHDLVGDEVQSTSSFAGAPAVSFATDGVEPAQGTFNVGASISYAMENNWEFTADYDLDIKSDYDAHAAYLRAGYKF